MRQEIAFDVKQIIWRILFPALQSPAFDIIKDPKRVQPGELKAAMNAHVAVDLPKRNENAFLHDQAMHFPHAALDAGEIAALLHVAEQTGEFTVSLVAHEIPPARTNSGGIEQRPQG